MPIYEYQCQACDHKLEAIQKVGDPPLKSCPACSKRKLKKRLSAGAFRLSGNGWYETDFKTGSKKNLAGDGASGASKSPDTTSTGPGGDSPSKTGSAADSAASNKASTAA